MSKNTKPRYYLKQSDLIERAGVQINHLENHLETFSIFDHSISIDFLNKYKVLLKNVSDNLPDRVIIARIAQYTDTVKIAMKDCKLFYHKIKYFAKQAFSDSVAVQNEFGQKNYAKVKYSKVELLQFMKNITGVLLKYEDELPARNMPVELIEESTVLYKNLEQTISEQELYKRKRRVLTADRIKNMNKLWELMVSVSQAAKIIFKDEPAMRNLFKLPPKRKPKHNKVTEKQLKDVSGYSEEESIY